MNMLKAAVSVIVLLAFEKYYQESFGICNQIISLLKSFVQHYHLMTADQFEILKALGIFSEKKI